MVALWTDTIKLSFPVLTKDIWLDYHICSEKLRKMLDLCVCVCNKALLKYKGDGESFWHRHQKGVERVSSCYC